MPDERNDARLIHDLEVLRVGADEVLILRVPPQPVDSVVVSTLIDALIAVGLRERSLVIASDEIKLAVVKR